MSSFNVCCITNRSNKPEQWLVEFRQTLHYGLLAIVLVGILLNSGVLLFLIRILRRQMGLTPAWALLAMCVADIACLLSLGTYSVLGRLVFDLPENRNFAKATFCRLNLFIVHAASAFSIWCWVVLSFLRYVAIFHPLVYANHSRIRQPSRILQGSGIVCVALEAWILATVQFNPEISSCSTNPQIPKLFTTALHVFEICWTYYIPIVLITVMDVIVLIRSYNASRSSTYNLRIPGNVSSQGLSYGSVECLPNQVTLSLNGSAATLRPRNCRHRRHLQLLKRYLLLMSIDLLMNLPSCTIRLIGAIDPRMYGNVVVDEILPGVAYVLYYSQFCINVLYLWVLMDRWDRTRQKPTPQPMSNANNSFVLHVEVTAANV